MTEAVANGHLSIGEVLALVQADFPDVTISKIRFLESQGLIAPERTASGLPQVLRRRHRAAPVDPGPAARPLPAAEGHQEDARPGRGRRRSQPGPAQPVLVARRRAAALPTSPPSDRRSRARRRRRYAAFVGAPGGQVLAEGGRPSAPSRPPSPAADAATDEPGKRHSTPADVVAALQEDPRPAKAARQGARRRAAARGPRPRAPPQHRDPVRWASRPPGEPMTREELCAATGVTEELLVDLDSYGLLSPSTVGGMVDLRRREPVGRPGSRPLRRAGRRAPSPPHVQGRRRAGGRFRRAARHAAAQAAQPGVS